MLGQLFLDSLSSADLLMLSSDLWASLSQHMTDELLHRRDALAGEEEQNGFEIWRILVWDHEGEHNNVR